MKENKILFTSDSHWGHTNIIGYCNRPFTDVDQMNEEMIRRWNEVVGPEDIVYYLGDFALGDKKKIPYILSRLQGHKHLVYGNHDDLSYHPMDNVFKAEKNGYWESIQEELYKTIDGKIVWMAHIPFGHDNDKRKYERPIPKQNFEIALNGHVHNKWIVNTSECINVGVDVWDFYPKTLQQLIEGTKDVPRFDSNIFLPV